MSQNGLFQAKKSGTSIIVCVISEALGREGFKSDLVDRWIRTVEEASRQTIDKSTSCTVRLFQHTQVVYVPLPVIPEKGQVTCSRTLRAEPQSADT